MGELGQALVGAGIALAALWNGWQSWTARREAKRAKEAAAGAGAHAETAARNAAPVSNGFAAEVTRQLGEILVTATEGRDAAVRAEDKIDRHLEAHANAQLQVLPGGRAVSR